MIQLNGTSLPELELLSVTQLHISYIASHLQSPNVSKKRSFQFGMRKLTAAHKLASDPQKAEKAKQAPNPWLKNFNPEDLQVLLLVLVSQLGMCRGRGAHASAKELHVTCVTIS